MKANITNNKKNTTMRKIVPAAGMLSISAVMLATSTYAWFTMSREVEVTGIKMTASVPENLEISLGKGMITGAGLETANTNTNATKVTEPVNTGAKGADEKDWTNSVAVGDFYDFGYLLPASSDNGTDIWYTLNANDAGRSVDVNATFAQADDDTPEMTSYNVLATKGTHATNYAEGVTKGYYIDIPVWFRTSAASNVELGVVATVTTGTLNGENVTGTGNLYKAARVAILDADGAANTNSANKIMADSATAGLDGANATYYDRYKTLAQGAVTDSQQAVFAAGSLNGSLAKGTTAATDITNANTLYKKVSWLTQASKTNDAWNGDSVVTVPAPTAGGTRLYGESVEKTIRVWLEGEDTNCWNPNASQSFTIDLKFVTKGTLDAPTAANQSGTGG